MCGCRSKRNKVTKVVTVTRTEELVKVSAVDSMPEPVYGCVTGARYPFDEEGWVYMDVRDAKCLSSEYKIWQPE